MGNILGWLKGLDSVCEGLHPTTVLPEIRTTCKEYNMNPQPIETHTGTVVAQDKKGRGGQSASLLVTEKRKRANKAFTVATYNVRTLNNSTTSQVTVSHKIQQIITGCETNNISIVAIQEHRLKTTSDINFEKYGSWTLAHTNSSHECHGVALLYDKEIGSLVTSVTRKSNRLIALHIIGNPKISIISAYAPTEIAEDATKDSFYEELKELLSSIPSHTVTILAGDFNARLGVDSHSTFNKIIGRSCFHESTNDNGHRLIELCETSELRPLHTHFANRKSRLSTYRPKRKILPD